VRALDPRGLPWAQERFPLRDAQQAVAIDEEIGGPLVVKVLVVDFPTEVFAGVPPLGRPPVVARAELREHLAPRPADLAAQPAPQGREPIAMVVTLSGVVGLSSDDVAIGVEQDVAQTAVAELAFTLSAAMSAAFDERSRQIAGGHRQTPL
jgi:hypothetical protein